MYRLDEKYRVRKRGEILDVLWFPQRWWRGYHGDRLNCSWS